MPLNMIRKHEHLSNCVFPSILFIFFVKKITFHIYGWKNKYTVHFPYRGNKYGVINMTFPLIKGERNINYIIIVIKLLRSLR